MPQLTRDDPRDKRQAILDAARDVFASRGYEEATIAEIARAAGVAVGTIYLYFLNKHDILVDVCLALHTEVARPLRTPQILAVPLRQAPRAIIEAIFRVCRRNMRFMACYQVEAQSPEEALRLRSSRREIADSLDTYFRQVIAQGRLVSFDTAAYAALLDGLVSATVRQCFTIERGEREVFHREGLIELIERLFFGPPIAAGDSGRDGRSPDDG